MLWALFPVLFFSFSGSKLPGYILPSIPPITILIGDYLNRIRRSGLSAGLLGAHAAACGVLVFVLVLAPQHMKYETLVPSPAWLMAAAAAAVVMALLVVLIIRRWGIPKVLYATLLPVLSLMVFLLGFYGRELDRNYSARPLAQSIQSLAPEVRPLAVLHVRRDMDYGLAFYRNQPTIHYSLDGVPQEEHLLVFRSAEAAEVNRWLGGRVYQSILLFDTQGLEVYRVAAATKP